MAEGSEKGFGVEYETNSRRANLAAYVLVAGLVLEIIIAVVWYHGIETLAAMAATTLIVLGVWGEIFFGHKARVAGDKQLAQYELKTAEANARAAEIARELTKLKNPRSISPDELKEELIGIPAGEAVILFEKHCSDCEWLAHWISNGLLALGWKATRPHPLPPPPPGSLLSSSAHALGGQLWGVSVVANTNENGTAAAALMRAFAKLLGHSGGGISQELPDDFVRIIVAPKP